MEDGQRERKAARYTAGVGQACDTDAPKFTTDTQGRRKAPIQGTSRLSCRTLALISVTEEAGCMNFTSSPVLLPKREE